jgi:hypothetical protein
MLLNGELADVFPQRSRVWNSGVQRKIYATQWILKQLSAF